MTTHNWQAVDGGFVCAGCGMKSLKGTSRAECKPRGSKRESEPRKPVELTPEEAARMARLSAARNAREHCRHRGEQLTKDGKPWPIRAAAHPRRKSRFSRARFTRRACGSRQARRRA